VLEVTVEEDQKHWLRPGELAEQDPSFRRVGSGGLFGGGKIAEVDLAPQMLDLCAEAPARVPEHAFDASAAIAASALIGEILRPGTKTQVSAPVVEGIHVGVIDIHSVRGVQKKPMHSHRAVFAVPLSVGHGVCRSSPAFAGVPIEVGNKRNVGCINDGFKPILEGYIGYVAVNSNRSRGEFCHAR
jgi:hypothetical protein